MPVADRVAQCASLRHLLGEEKVSAPNSSVYAQAQSSYYAKQESELSPACIVQPTSSLDVSLTVKGVGLLNLLGIHTKLALRGGGHDPNPGSANIEGGVTMDMRALNHVAVDESKMIVSVGAGARWQDVYPLLDAKNLSVAGGRLSNVGVAGLILGGPFLDFP